MKIILAHGTFDLIHYGHILLFKVARTLGDKLIVTLTADKFVAKGHGRPIFNEQQRLAWVKELRPVDEAYIMHESTGVGAIALFRPALYVKGRDTHQGSAVIEEERHAVEAVGGEITYINTGTTFHSSELLSGKYLAARAHS